MEREMNLTNLMNCSKCCASNVVEFKNTSGEVVSIPKEEVFYTRIGNGSNRLPLVLTSSGIENGIPCFDMNVVTSDFAKQLLNKYKILDCNDVTPPISANPR